MPVTSQEIKEKIHYLLAILPNATVTKLKDKSKVWIVGEGEQSWEVARYERSGLLPPNERLVLNSPEVSPVARVIFNYEPTGFSYATAMKMEGSVTEQFMVLGSGISRQFERELAETPHAAITRSRRGLDHVASSGRRIVRALKARYG